MPDGMKRCTCGAPLGEYHNFGCSAWTYMGRVTVGEHSEYRKQSADRFMEWAVSEYQRRRWLCQQHPSG